MSVLKGKIVTLVKKLILAASVMSLTACASTQSPGFRIDPRASVNGGANFQNDLFECEKFAFEALPQGSGRNGAVQRAATNAGAGAALGAVTAAIFGGDVSNSAGIGALFGGTSGAIAGQQQVEAERRNIVGRCLSGRGYSVISGY